MKIEDILAISPPNQFEDLADYKVRISSQTNNLPDVFTDQLLHRHYPHFKGLFGELSNKKLSFQFKDFSIDQVLSTIGYDIEENLIFSLGRFGNKDREAELKLRFDNGTWIKPIIICENVDNLWPTNKDYYLIDGHLRLGRLKTIARKRTDKLCNCHKVLILKLSN